MISRREWITGALLAAGSARAARPPGVLINTHVHLVSDDAAKFPFAAGRTSRPLPVEQYAKFAVEAGCNYTVIVSPEPYQDDMRYLEYCLTPRTLSRLL